MLADKACNAARAGDRAANAAVRALRDCRSPYRVVDDGVLCPIGSDEAAKTLTRAFVDLKSSGLAGGREHLNSASNELSAGNFAASVRESIQAVESVVRVLEPSGDFSQALARFGGKDQYTRSAQEGIYRDLWASRAMNKAFGIRFSTRTRSR
jgi:hypothetical protein